jgi:hypothetical protein
MKTPLKLDWLIAIYGAVVCVACMKGSAKQSVEAKGGAYQIYIQVYCRACFGRLGTAIALL